MTHFEMACLVSLAVVLGVAAASDLRSRRIPNILVLCGLAAGLFFQAVAPEGHGLLARWFGSVGLLQGLYGVLVGLAIFLPFYMLRTLGAGDVKLLAMLGAWFGPHPMVGVAIFTMVCGGLLALSVALWTRSLRQALGNIGFMLTDTLVRATATGRTTVSAPARTTGRLPYAIAVMAGAACEVVLLKEWYR
jgi:prepilin peptidase CpaA